MVLKYKLFTITVILSILILFLWFFKWSFEDSLFHYLLFVSVLLLYIVLIFFSFVQLIKYHIWYSFMVVILTIFIFITFDITSLYVSANFYLNKEARDKIVQKLINERLINIKKEKLIHLSSYKLFPVATDSIILKDRCVYFPLFHYTQGIVYCDSKKINHYILKNGYRISKKYNNRWYWITAK